MKTVYNWPDSETPVSIVGPMVRADWYMAGEGYCGDYDPDDPFDKELLRFDIYKRKDPAEPWEEVDDASYCTTVPADSDQDYLVKLLTIIYREYEDVISSDYDASVKKLGEALSWIN